MNERSLRAAIATVCFLACAAHGGAWEPLGLSGGGGMFTPAISPADPQRMMVNCDMSAAYLSPAPPALRHDFRRQRLARKGIG